MPALQTPFLSKSLDLTLSQYALQDRILVLLPSPHVLLHDDHVVHEVYSGGPKKGFCVDLSAQYLRIFKKETSRSTFARLKRDSEKILNAETHREKRATYITENHEEKKLFEKHCVKVITDCYKRKYAIKLSETLVTQILINEKASFDYL